MGIRKECHLYNYFNEICKIARTNTLNVFFSFSEWNSNFSHWINLLDKKIFYVIFECAINFKSQKLSIINFNLQRLGFIADKNKIGNVLRTKCILMFWIHINIFICYCCLNFVVLVVCEICICSNFVDDNQHFVYNS